MTGAVASAFGGRLEVMSLAAISTPSSTAPRSFTIGGTAPFTALDGDLEHAMAATDDGGTNELTWLSNGSPSSWEVRATALTGTVTTGTMGSWEALSSARTWTKTDAAACTITLEIGRAGLNTALATAVVTL